MCGVCMRDVFICDVYGIFMYSVCGVACIGVVYVCVCVVYDLCVAFIHDVYGVYIWYMCGVHVMCFYV